MTTKTIDFLEANKRALLRNYADYIEAQTDQRMKPKHYSEIESFAEWIEQEYDIAKKEGATGEGNYL